MSNKHFKIVVKEAKKNESKSDGERAVDDYDTLIDGLKELGFEPSSNVRNGKIYPYRTRFTATKDGIKYGFTLNEDRTGEYLESIEVVGGSIYTGDPQDKDARVFKSVGEVLDALKQVDGKKSEAMDMSRAKQIVMGDTSHNPKTVAEEIAWSAWVESDGHPKALLRKAARDYYNSGLLASAERARYLLDTYTDEMRELYKEFTSSVEPAEVASTGEVIPWSSFEDMSSKNEADAEAFIQWITENVARKLVRYANESMKSENATAEEDAIRKAFKSIVNHVPANEKSNFDDEFVTDNMEALLDLFNAWFVFDDGEFVTTVRVVDPDNENGDCYDEDDEAYQWNACYNVTEGIIDLLGWNYGEETVKQPIQDALFYDFIGTKYIDNSNESKNHKKSESLSLKQKELKDMVRYGEAEDITTISDAEAKELRKKGIELVGVSRGTYGMNGALLRDNEGKKYAITARSSNLFYFV